MVQSFRYIDTYGHTFDENIETQAGTRIVRLGQEDGFSESANLLEVSQSTIVFDDPLANVGHSGDAIRGLKQFAVDESDETAGNRRVFMGYIRDRIYSRGDSERPSLITGTARQIEVSLEDPNAIANFRIFTSSTANSRGTGNRPAESVGSRLEWLLRTDFGVIVTDEGFVDYPFTVQMDANDYGLQRAGDVLADCALAASYNTFIYWDEAHSHFALWFKNSNTSTAYSSTLRLCGLLADADFATTWPATGARLGRSPDRTYAGVAVPYANGNVYVTRAATADNYGWRDGVAPNANIKSASRATSDGNQFLGLSATEEDRAYCDVELPSHLVNHIRAGMRIQAKWPWFPADSVSGLDYSDFVWFRVLKRTVMQVMNDQLRYTLRLELSPQGGGAAGGTCSTAVTAAEATGTVAEATGTFGPVSIPVSAASFNSAMQIGFFAYIGPSMGLGGCAPLVVGGGWTLLDQSSGGGDSEWPAVGYLSQPTIATPPNMTVSATCSGGGFPFRFGYTFAFPSSSTAPVQQSAITGTGNAILPAPPTVGNILYFWSMSSETGADTTQWTSAGGRMLVDNAAHNGTQWWTCIGIRCVTSSDTTTTIRIPTGSHATIGAVSEWRP